MCVVLGSLCSEMEFLRSEAKKKFYDPILFYGECPGEPGDEILGFSRFLSILNEIVLFQEHARNVIKNVMQQMAVLHGFRKQETNLISTNRAHFHVKIVLFITCP